jgi:serine/threonine-protein kinase
MPEPDRDALLADLIARLTEQAQRGESPRIDEFAARHPELAIELRALWATAQFVDEFGGGPSDPLARTILPMPPAARSGPDEDHAQNAPQRLGDYELLEKIGEGGMGVVFTARQLSLNRIVAFKMIRHGALASATDAARFRAEAAAAAQLEHPNIVPVFEVGEHEGQPYFSMKHVAGTTLARKLADGPLPPREAAALLLPVCRAIACAHEHGIIHRDLKPSNILIDTAGQPQVADFGLAKRVERGLPSFEESAPAGTFSPAPLTRTGAILGTPSFMSPEQAAGSRGDVGPASDVYSLGAILYNCLTGRPAFQAPSPLDVVLMVLEQEPVLPRILNPKADPDLEIIAQKCLQKPAELRYASATALADDLAAYLANEPISARSTNITQLVSRIFRETHHAGVLEQWGLLWMWHSLALFVLCAVTNWFQWRKIESRLPYLALWIVGMGAWAAVFWTLRRRAGPITFIERQIAHVWGASMVASSLLFAVETLLGMPVLTLSPVLPLIGASVFVIKAGILSGAFYVQAIALFATALVMAWLREAHAPDFGLTLYGIVSAACFFVPGWQYWKRKERQPRG